MSIHIDIVRVTQVLYGHLPRINCNITFINSYTRCDRNGVTPGTQRCSFCCLHRKHPIMICCFSIENNNQLLFAFVYIEF